jgi:hypothetical protein
MLRNRARRDIARVGLRANDWLQHSSHMRPRSASGRQVVARSWAAAGPDAKAMSASSASPATRMNVSLPNVRPAAAYQQRAGGIRRRHILPVVSCNLFKIPIEIEDRRMLKRTAAGLVALVTAFVAWTTDQASAQEQQAFKSLIGRGFEIKSVTFAKGEATSNRETFVVTLQREKSVAVCYFAATSWINLSNNALEDGKRCDVR